MAPGWRGGRYISVTGNTIERANHMGIDSFARLSTFESNLIRDVGMIANLGQSGMGCGMDDGEGACTEDGAGIRIKVDQRAYTGNSNILQYNRLERIGHNGMDVFGFGNTVYRNVISQPCFSKGDCGGLRSFGSDNLSNTSVYDLIVRENIIVDSVGNTDGARSDFELAVWFWAVFRQRLAQRDRAGQHHCRVYGGGDPVPALDWGGAEQHSV